MRIDLNVLEHLGLKMYTNLPAVISEYVANSWDAWATEVDIQIPDGPMNDEYEITIVDDGFGMTIEDVNKKFLVVGRNRRTDEGDDTTELDGETRKVMGRKGIGKLAGFGVANVINVWTYKNGKYVEFELNYSEMRERASDDPRVKTDYEPTIVDFGVIENEETEGSVIILKELKRKRAPNADYVRQKLARRFGVIGESFRVVVNEDPIEVGERDLKDRCQFIKEFDGVAVDDEGECEVEGWFGTLEKHSTR